MNQPRIDPDTVEALLDTTWRLLAAEDARTESLDRKAGGLATFASVILSLLAAFASTLLESFDDVSVFALLVLSLACLVGAVGYSVHVLLPKEHLALGMRYVERFPKWSELLKPAEQVRGETMTGLVEAIARGRMINREKAVRVRTGLKLLFVGLAALALDVAILAGKELFHRASRVVLNKIPKRPRVQSLRPMNLRLNPRRWSLLREARAAMEAS